jgi:SAM-dependent methyltransferase
MALGRDVVDAIIREHSYRPIAGDVLLIGQLTVSLGADEVLELMREHGVAVEDDAAHIVRQGGAEGGMSAAGFFKLLGVDAVRTLGAENADIVQDLGLPIPQRLENSADFIVDGGAVADLFSPAIAVRNYASMLRPGGRLVVINNLSGHFDPYSIPSPAWYLDYFVVNGFADCKTYILVYLPERPANAFCVDIDCLLDPAREVRTFLSPDEMAVVLFAEKGEDSTDQVMPIHVHRRSAAESERYRQNLGRIKQNERPHLVRSRGDMEDIDVRGGHLFMQTDYTAVDPSTLRRRTAARGEPEPRSLKILCVGSGRDGTQSLCNMIQHVFAGSDRKVMHEYCCREFYQAFCDFAETGERASQDALKRMVDECAYDSVVGNGYAVVLPLFAERYGRGLKIVHVRRDDRDACIASLVKNSELFPTAYRYYAKSPYATVKRMAAFHFGEMSRAQWDGLSIEEKFGWYYDKTHALIREHLDLFDEHMEITTESLNDETSRRAIAQFVGGDSHAPPPKAHLNASVIDIASFPKERQHKMHWLMGRLNIEQLASDEVYALDYFLDKFVAWTGYQIVDSPSAETSPAPAEKIAADLDRAAKVIGDRLRDIDALHQLVRDRSGKDTGR